ncbi:hypothetical protein MJO28_001514 [Puccinia striiformis f. sp. tritici]|uniref:DUF6534 domain-containing protein n=2 Tax=Puccinia striiformis f. sp. tritici TaxID=168172 RepID=A0A0L0UXV0_9BASI|nr:hypothetical protein Pst134EA_003232 [Puccinia striiformis f. sp. tritici]KAI9611412.1 hypothetical protein H4Q26_008362 [Puccinia striiformis f. sp. tritici PST-130]KNE91564.1 hypothetical protein PSTG_15016 [Puccinia striiformis f. sp. tritici PST-78]KAH9464777.1 hypothetical protein Pst134EB_004288 [Puccinia striiformis f. sp. tritici]KAH9472625.1 hypothetical protein Pst134EA_003232 [Puccinia striiformis f. sp. tritici]KAI7961025.1 hypothetical protein MJO28_001514 [Puccinia striiformis
MAQAPVSVAKLLEGLTGPFVVGTAVSTFLFGITMAQVYTYFSNFKNDRPIYRYSVIGLFVLDVLHTAFSQVTLWQWFVAHYGEPAAVVKAPWSFAMSPVMCGLAAFVVQIFYAHRVYLLSNRRIIVPGFIGFGALFQLVWASGATAKVFQIQFFQGFQVWTYGVACWLGGAAVTDLLITASLVWILLNSKRGIRRTNNIIDRLISLTIETNGLTFTVAVLDLVLFSAFKDASHVAPHLCLVKLYINSFLVTLNSREKLAEEFGGSRTIHTSAPRNGHTEGSKLSCTLAPSHLHSDSPLNEKITTIYDGPDGVRVCTTATLSANLMPSDPEISQIGYNGGPMRPDHSNGFTSDIVGGTDLNKVYHDMGEKNMV